MPSLLFPGSAPVPDDGADDDDQRAARDLNVDQIVTAVAGRREQPDLITRVLSRRLRDPGVVRYRQEVFQDLEDPDLSARIREFTGQMDQVAAHLHQMETMRYQHQREGWLLDAAALYGDAVTALAAFLGPANLGSRALRAFRDYLSAYAASGGFTSLARETRDLRVALGRIRFRTRIRGDRVEVSRYQGEADYSEQVLAAFDRFRQGAARDYRLTYRTEPGTNHITAQITELVARLFPDEFTALESYCRRHAAFADEGILRAAAEFRFYLAYADHIAPLRAAGLGFCYPEIPSAPARTWAEATFDLALAHALVARGTPVVTNDFRLDTPERIMVVTGPNQGGKTTFARTFGQLHHLAATGCPVPGSAAALPLPDRVLTHFEREEDIARMTGKLEDDLLRAGEIARAATSRSVVVLNETFASTTTSDARFLGTKLLTALTRTGARCVYVTFVDELASCGEQVVSMMSTVDPANPADRTYKVVRKPADGLAYALAIAAKRGVTYERLRERLAR